MRVQILPLILLLMLFVSCDRSIKLFENNKIDVVCEKIEVDFLIALNIELMSMDSLLILNDFSLNPMVSVLNTNNNTLMSKFLDKGEGPNECIPPIQMKEFEDSIYVLERQTATLYKFGKSMILDQNVNLHKVWHIENSINTFSPLNDTLYIASRNTDGERFSLINNRGDEIKAFGEYPDLMPGEEEYSNESKGMFHQTFFLKAMGEKRIAAISPHVLEIYSYDENYNFVIAKQILFSKYKYTHTTGNILKATPSQDTARGGMCFYGTDKYIYVVYNPENERAYYSNPNKHNNEIWVFDWEGNPIKALLPDKDVYTIAVDNDDSNIYVVDKDSELYKIRINNIL